MKGLMERIDALCKLVEIITKDYYGLPGSGHIVDDEINTLLEVIKNDR